MKPPIYAIIEYFNSGMKTHKIKDIFLYTIKKDYEEAFEIFKNRECRDKLAWKGSYFSYENFEITKIQNLKY